MPTDPEGVAAMTAFLLSFARLPASTNDHGTAGAEAAVAPKKQQKHLTELLPVDRDSKSVSASAVVLTQIESTVCISDDSNKVSALSARQVASCIRSAAAAGGGRGRTLVRGELQDQALYERYRAIWNGMHDRHPGVIAVASEVSARECVERRSKLCCEMIMGFLSVMP